MLLLPMLYLPPVTYMALLHTADEVRIEAYENYIKSTYRNRCEIPGANGKITLSIPLTGGRDHHRLYRESRISYTDGWQHRHLMSIISCYGSAPFYEHYIDYFKPFYERRHEHLYEFNRELLLLLIRLMKLDVKVNYTDVYDKNPAGITDMRYAFKTNHPITDLSIGQKKWHLGEVPYISVFESTDVASMHMSSLDLLFNTGPGSRSILDRMVTII
jgi:hypothetical protein